MVMRQLTMLFLLASPQANARNGLLDPETILNYPKERVNSSLASTEKKRHTLLPAEKKIINISLSGNWDKKHSLLVSMLNVNGGTPPIHWISVQSTQSINY